MNLVYHISSWNRWTGYVRHGASVKANDGRLIHKEVIRIERIHLGSRGASEVLLVSTDGKFKAVLGLDAGPATRVDCSFGHQVHQACIYLVSFFVEMLTRRNGSQRLNRGTRGRVLARPSKAGDGER